MHFKMAKDFLPTNTFQSKWRDEPDKKYKYYW